MQIFTLVDTDGSGQISAHEVRHLMKLLGETVELSEVEALIQDFDLDGSGEVDLTEFILVLALQRKSDYKRADVLRCARACMPRNTAIIVSVERWCDQLVAVGRSTSSPSRRRHGGVLSIRMCSGRRCCSMAQASRAKRRLASSSTRCQFLRRQAPTILIT